MSLYLNKIGLIRYNNDTYQQINLPLYYSVRDPQLVSTDPRINFFNYPWKSDNHWSYVNYGLGWYYNGKDLIAYTVEIPSSSLSCYSPVSGQNISSSYLYNVIPILLFLLSSVSANLLTSKIFEDPRQLYYLRILSTANEPLYLIRIKFDNDYRAYYTYYEEERLISSHTYTVQSDDPTISGKHLVLDWLPSDINSEYQASEEIHETPSSIVSGYWVNGTTIQGILYTEPKLGLGSVDDIYSNELQFEVKSPNIENVHPHFLCSNFVEGLFTNIPGTDYITGICTTKMYFINDQYVYMRGLFKGNIEIKSGIYQNEVIAPSTIIKEVSVKNLQGTLKNITDLPDEIKYGLDYYYAWGWLYGIDNIKYENIWYKNEISGLLNSSGNNYDEMSIINDRYTGVLSTSIISNNGTEDVVNIITGVFYKDEKQNTISGFMEGTIEPFSIKMKGLLTGYYTVVSNSVIKPLQLSGVLYNKSVIGLELRTILDIKYANTLGRKGLTYPDPLHGLNLNFATKNYDPFNNPYMLLSWKIIEYKVSKEEVDYENEIPYGKMDLNTYLVDNKYVQHNYKSKIHKTDELLNSLLDENGKYYVFWNKTEDTGDFVIQCNHNEIPTVSNYLTFNRQVDALVYIKNMCGLSNIKLKQYISLGNITKYILDSSDLEIK